MDTIKTLANELEDIIIDNLNFGLFKIDIIQIKWEEKHPEIPLKNILTELVSQNKVGMANKTHYEYRDTGRTD